MKRSTLSALAGVALLVTGFLAWQATGFRLDGINGTLLGGGLAALLFFLVTDASQVGAFARARSTRYWFSTAVLTVFVAAILVMLNFLALRHHPRWDLTEGGVFSLSPQTVELLESLEEDVELLWFSKEDNLRMEIREYQYKSDHLKYRFIDPDADPATARIYDIDQYQTLVISSGERTQRVESPRGQAMPTEEDIVNALMAITRDSARKVYFTIGHGEPSLDDMEGRDGLGVAREQLEREQLAVEGIFLDELRGEVPEDCSVLVIAGPTADFTDREIEGIQTYVDGGGAVLLLGDPPNAAGMDDLAHLVGFEFDGNLLADVYLNLMGGGYQVDPRVRVNTYSEHKITDQLKEFTQFAMAQSVRPLDDAGSAFDVHPLLFTGENVAMVDDYAGEPIEALAGGDFTNAERQAVGMVAVRSVGGSDVEEFPGAEPHATGPESRVAVFGDSDFARNSLLGLAGNRDLLLNTVNWLSADEAYITVRAKSVQDTKLLLDNVAQGWLKALAFFMPLAAIFSGIVVVVRRRK